MTITSTGSSPGGRIGGGGTSQVEHRRSTRMTAGTVSINTMVKDMPRTTAAEATTLISVDISTKTIPQHSWHRIESSGTFPRHAPDNAVSGAPSSWSGAKTEPS